MGHSTKTKHSFLPRAAGAVGLTLLITVSLWPLWEVRSKWEAWLLALVIFAIICGILLSLVNRTIRRPIRKLISGTEELINGNYEARVDIPRNGELGHLADAINLLGKTIGEKEATLNQQRDDYQRLFEMVPCIITVQDQDYRLIRYNRQFAEKFHPRQGDYCYCAYKGREEKCESCPVEKTFSDGLSHYSQETAFLQDGTARHWIVRTSPIKDAAGKIVAAMEMSLDVTYRKLLQHALELSEKKYYAIFNNIANPIFVLDSETLDIIDCNDAVMNVYGYTKSEIRNLSFMDLFHPEDRNHFRARILEDPVINQVRQVDKSGHARFFSMRISPSDYPGEKVLLVTTHDITQWLETEQQLIQASKMATLGEMATGVAHELNQPLSVIKTAGSYFIKKIRKGEQISPEILATLAEEIDSHVDRATRIISHMRQFGRKSSGELEPVSLNDILRRAFEIFRQQLKLREISVCWELSEGMPAILGDEGRLEQVFINLFINARDAIEEASEGRLDPQGDKRIMVRSRCVGASAEVEVQDSGVGIDPALAERVFEPFFTTKKVGKGTGLGLSISYGIVKDCGGSIQVVPCEGGACFRLTFPIPPTPENGESP
jgi:histidine kinase